MNPMRDAINSITQVEMDEPVLDYEQEAENEYSQDYNQGNVHRHGQEPEPEVCILSDFAHEALHMVACSHMWHLQTQSFAAHKALGEFYDGLSGLADGFLEASIGVNGPINPVQTPFMFTPADEAVTSIKEFHHKADNLHNSFQDSPALTNPLEDIMTLCASTLYKLQYLQ